MHILIIFLSIIFSGATFAQDIKAPQALKMHSRYIDEEIREHEPVMYLNDDQLAKYKVIFKNGLMYDQDQRLISSYHSTLPTIFIIDLAGDFYLSRYQKHNQFQHSSLSRGLPVQMAGELFVKDGQPLAIDHRSGHYLPPDPYLEFLRHYLAEREVNTELLIAAPAAVQTYLNDFNSQFCSVLLHSI